MANNKTRRKGGSKKRSTSKSRSRSKSPGSSIKSRGAFQSPTPESLKNKCPICLEIIRSGHIKTKCGHDFHKKCLIQWCENQKQHAITKCPMCKRDIQETCDKIIPFDSAKIFNYTNIAGADIKRRSESIAKVAEFVNNPEFDVNVVNPRNNVPILYTLTLRAYAFHGSIEKLLENKKTKIDADIISLLTSKYLSDDQIIKLFKQNPKANKLLKPFI
jgi:hypothetical protein